jgi:aspartate/methionine/tyrosine aminotransferase
MEHLLIERRQTFELLKQRYHTLKEEFTKMDSDLVTVEPFQGGFFCFVSLRPESGLRATALANYLLDEHGVGTVPFEGNDINGLRIAFCSVDRKDLPELCRRLAQAVNELAAARRETHEEA